MKAFYALLAGAGVTAAQSLAEVIAQNNGTLSTLASLVQQAGLLETLASAQGITILAPTNDAFAALPAAPSGDLLAAVLQYHVLNGTVRAADITGAGRPLFPRTLLSDGDYEDVDGAQYLQVAGAGNNVTITSGLAATSNVVTADVTFSGGVIHVIDSVLTLPANVTATAVAADLRSLAGALTSTGLLGPVNDAENVTIFAPSNAAFQAIGSVLQNATNETIASVLQYHVIPGNVIFSTGLSRGAQVPTLLQGSQITVNQEGNTFFINGAAIVTPNVLVENGVVHVIDQVLNPMNATAGPAPSATAGSVQFSGAVAASEPPLTSGIPAPSSTIGSSPSGTGAAGSSSSGPATSTGAAAVHKAIPLAGAIAAGAAFLL